MQVYLLKVSVAIVLFYLLYQLVFSRFRLFHANRIYILFSLCISFLLPFVKFPSESAERSIMEYSLGINWDQFAEFSGTQSSVPATGFSIPLPVLITGIYLLIVLGLLSLKMIRLAGRKKFNAKGIQIQHSGIRVLVHPEVSSPFTVFRTVYLDKQTYESGNAMILKHEMVHARQLHSIDLLISEIICSFLWFNPFVFLFKKQMRENHEFLADNYAHEGGASLIGYMHALSNELSRRHDPVFASYFKSSTIKKRIIMLTNNKSDKNKRGYYLIIAPFLLLLILAFQQPVEVLSENPFLVIKSGAHGSAPSATVSTEHPSRFPLDDQFKKGVTADFDKHMKNPITKEMMTHKGIDYRAPQGMSVYAAGSGIIEKSEMHEKYGNVIVIKHDASFVTLYAHLHELFVEVGDEVKIGQKIGTVGSTGLSTGPHLHYEVRKDGENVNPADYY